MSNSPRIAIAVDRNGQLWEKYFCTAPYFAIYTAEGTRLDIRANPYNNLKNKPVQNPQLLINLLAECQVFIGKTIAMPEHIAEFNVMAIETSAPTPLAAIAEFDRFARA